MTDLSGSPPRSSESQPEKRPVPEISIVLPMHDEASNVTQIVSSVAMELDALGRPAEIICVDDGSSDDTAALVERFAQQDKRLVLVRLSRNFGKEAALAAGLDTARGRAVVFLDADLQHPTDLIPAMVAKWDEGFDVVDAFKATSADRGREPMSYRAAATLFYKLLEGNAGERLRGSSDYKLLDRQVVDTLRQLPERHRFFRGIVAWVGFRVTRVPLQVRPRAAGASKWGPAALLRYAVRNLVSFTSMPLRLVGWLGLVTLLLDAVLGAQTFWNWWRGNAVTGFTTVILTVVGLGGLILLSLGVIAVYLAQMYDELKARPVYVVRRPRNPEP
ncbi:MAG: glycosyltransferase family 2 protein [Vicinamibacterales bacterium]